MARHKASAFAPIAFSKDAGNHVLWDSKVGKRRVTSSLAIGRRGTADVHLGKKLRVQSPPSEPKAVTSPQACHSIR